MSYIRKISVGPNFPDHAVHFQVGKAVLFDKDKGRKSHEVVGIEERQDITGRKTYDVYVENIPEDTGDIVSKVLWKTVSADMPIVVEYAIDFD